MATCNQGSVTVYCKCVWKVLSVVVEYIYTLDMEIINQAVLLVDCEAQCNSSISRIWKVVLLVRVDILDALRRVLEHFQVWIHLW